MQTPLFYNKPVDFHKDMCDNVSEMIVRTNPKLSTNTKIMTNGKNVSLDSFDATKNISTSKYKNFKTYNTSLYNKDISKFWTNTDSSHAYKVLQEYDDITVKDDFARQYETFYWAGCEYIDSLEYDEEYGLLAPLWLDEKIPERFVIFRINGPSYWYDETENGVSPKDFNFRKDILEKCEIIKTFDLTENSRLGSYIRRYKNQKGFPESPISFNEEYISFNGINYKTGEFTSKKEHYAERFWQHDDSVLEFDKYITEGFERNNIIVANLLNIQFLFDDPRASEYSFTRYFGLYCDVIKDGDFELSKNGLYNIENEYSYDVKDFSIYNNNPFIAKNENGVLVPFLLNDVTDTDKLPTKSILESEEINSVFCIEDIYGNLHSIDRETDAIAITNISDSNNTYSTLRLDEKEIDLDVFKGFVEHVESITCEYEENTTPSSLHCEIKSQIPPYSKIQVFRTIFGAETIIGEIMSVPHIASGQTVMETGKWEYDMFCGEGMTEEIAASICGSFNDVFDIGIHAYYNNEHIYFISGNSSPVYNTYGIRLVNCQNADNIVSFENDNMLFGSNKYDHVKCSEDEINSFKTGDYLPSKSNNGFSKIIAITTDFDSAEFVDDIVYFPKKKKYDILLDSAGVLVTRTNTTKIYKTFRPSYCRLSFYPVKDFELTTLHDTTKYGDIGELEYENGELRLLQEIYNVIYDSQENPLESIETNINNTDSFTVELILGEGLVVSSQDGTYSITITQDSGSPDTYTVSLSFLLVNSNYTANTTTEINADFAFDTLSTTLNVPMLTYLKSEYTRCYENFNPNLMTLSKTQPWICNWVLKNGVDVREKPYRLNNNPVFGQYSFTPDMNNHEPDPKCYNQEWMYIMSKPFLTSGVDQRRMWSYIGIDIDSIDDFENNLRSTTENWFDVYFKRDSIYTDGYYSTPDYMRKYSLFHNGTELVNARTFFRGVMIEFLSKSDWTEKIDNNLDELKTIYDTSLNDYKFTAVCVPLITMDGSPLYIKQNKIIKNDKFKTITFIHYITGTYFDAIDTYLLKKDPIKDQVNSMEIENICRGKMYIPVSEDAIAENLTKEPISIKGHGTITVSPNPKNTTTMILNGMDTSFLIDFEPYVHDFQQPENDTAVYNGKYYDKAILLVGYSNMPNESRIYSVMKIEDILSDSEMIAKPVQAIDIDQNEYLTVFDKLSHMNPAINANQMHLTTGNSQGVYDSYYILNCNHIQFLNNLNNCVFASIKHSINNTQPNDMIYELVDENGVIHSSENNEYPFAIKVIEPMENAKYEYMSLLYDGNWINYGILPNCASPMFRHTGRFTPLRNDILYYTDPFIREFTQKPNIQDQIKEKFFTGSRHMNTCFDTTISDFGIIHDLCFHRTNEINRNIFKLTNDEKPIYPISNKFAIGHRDVQVFNSSWDPWYFTRTLSNTNEEDCSGTHAMKENKSFFASKCLKTPDVFSFETFSISDNDTTKEILFENKSSHVEMIVNLEDKIIATLNENIHDMFEIYIDKQYSYGDKTTVDDDIIEYIKTNLLKLYQITDIKLWIKEEPTSSEPYFVFSGMDMNNDTKIQNKLKESHVMGISTIDTNQFNRKIIFNIRNRMRYTFGLSIVIEKK